MSERDPVRSAARRRPGAALVVLPLMLAALGASPRTRQYGPPQGSLTPEWHVEVVQDSSVRLRDNGAVVLRPAPFTLRVILPEPLAVELNVLDNNANFLALADSIPLDGGCFGSGMGMAEGFFNESEDLMVEEQGCHFLYYNGPADHRWSSATVTKSAAVFERRVRRLYYEVEHVPLSGMAGRSLYLIFVVDFPGHGERFKKVILNFEPPGQE